MQAFYADKTEIRTLSMDELSLVAGGFNWDKVQWGKAVAVGAVTGLSAGVAGLTGGPGVQPQLQPVDLSEASVPLWFRTVGNNPRNRIL